MPSATYENIADALVVAYRTGEASAMRMVWDYFGHMRNWDAMRRYVRLDLGRHEEPRRTGTLTICRLGGPAGVGCVDAGRQGRLP